MFLVVFTVLFVVLTYLHSCVSGMEVIRRVSISSDLTHRSCRCQAARCCDGPETSLWFAFCLLVVGIELEDALQALLQRILPGKR